MSRDDLRVPGYLGHILQAIQRINRYTEDMTEVAFLENELVQDAVIRNIEIIGEAARNQPPPLTPITNHQSPITGVGTSHQSPGLARTCAPCVFDEESQ